MIELVKWLSDHADATAAFGSIVGAASTLAIAALTVLLWLENRTLRKAGSEPRVVAHFEINPNGSGAVDISLSNVGTGPARDVSFSFIADSDDFNKYDIKIDHSKSRSAITLIPKGEKITFFFAIGFRLVRPTYSKKNDKIDPLKPFTINVHWKNLNGKTYSEYCLMDIMQFDDLPGIFEKPPLLKIVDSLDSIDKEIGGLRYQAQELRSIIDTTTIKENIRQETIESSINKSDSASP